MVATVEEEQDDPVDPEVAELYLGNRRLLVATTALALVTVVVLIAARPHIAASIGLPFR